MPETIMTKEETIDTIRQMITKALACHAQDEAIIVQREVKKHIVDYHTRAFSECVGYDKPMPSMPDRTGEPWTLEERLTVESEFDIFCRRMAAVSGRGRKGIEYSIARYLRYTKGILV